MRIAVLGGGNGSFAAAGDLPGRPRDAAVAARRAGGRGASRGRRHDHGQGFRGPPRGEAGAASPTTSAEAVRGAELILCPAPATAQADIAKALAPHLVDGQVVFLPPGTFGSVLFAKAARDAGNRADVAFAETGTLPWLARKHGPFEVAITMRAKRLPTGVFPLTPQGHALAVIAKAFPGVIEDCGDALSGALMNAGPIIHPPLIIMNAGAAGAFRALGHPQGRHAARDPPRHRRARCRAHRGARGAGLRRRRIFRSPTTTRRRARSGCTAAARTTS